jgi:hypothetical protein
MKARRSRSSTVPNHAFEIGTSGVDKAPLAKTRTRLLDRIYRRACGTGIFTFEDARAPER